MSIIQTMFVKYTLYYFCVYYLTFYEALLFLKCYLPNGLVKLVGAMAIRVSGGSFTDNLNTEKQTMANEKGTVIYVRGRPHEFDGEKISFKQVVDLGYPNGKHGPEYEYDVTWKDGPKERPDGILKEGEYVEVVKDMRFDVKFTDKS